MIEKKPKKISNRSIYNKVVVLIRIAYKIGKMKYELFGQFAQINHVGVRRHLHERFVCIIGIKGYLLIVYCWLNFLKERQQLDVIIQSRGFFSTVLQNVVVD
jgi:hypothetical protein